MAANERARSLRGFDLVRGSGAAANPDAVVFFDAQCPHCAALWRNAARLPGPLRIRWVPVGLLSRRSVLQGASLLRAPDGAAAMDVHERLRDDGGTGLPIDPGLRPGDLQAIRTNTAALRAMGLASVPAMLYRDPDGVPRVALGALSAAGLARRLRSGLR